MSTLAEQLLRSMALMWPGATSVAAIARQVELPREHVSKALWELRERRLAVRLSSRQVALTSDGVFVARDRFDDVRERFPIPVPQEDRL
jgi:DNA-binding IclR family transcriptional regulator